MIYAKYGEIWMRTSMPRDLKKAVESRFHLLNNFDHYIFLVIGIDRAGKRYILEATTYAQQKDYRMVLEHLPMTVEHHTRRVYGKLAPRHGIWEVQRLNWRHRGILYPQEKYWKSLFTGSYHQCKLMIFHLTRRNKKNLLHFQNIFRLKLRGTLRINGIGNYKVQMGDGGDYFLCNVPFYGTLSREKEERKRRRKMAGKEYYSNKMEK